MSWTGCLRTLFFIFNFFFWVSGGAILGLGIYFMVTDKVAQHLEVVEHEDSLPLYRYAYVLIIVGIFIFLAGFVGCCGAIRNSQCLLILYMICMVIVMAAEIALGALIIIYKNQIDDGLKTRLKENVKERYDDVSWPVFNKAWDYIQTEIRCCGVDGPKDYIGSNWRNMTGMRDKVPPTCCMQNTQNRPVNNTLCQDKAYTLAADDDYIHPKGCYDKLIDWFYKHVKILIGVGFAFACLEIIVLIVSICLCRIIGKKYNKYT